MPCYVIQSLNSDLNYRNSKYHFSQFEMSSLGIGLLFSLFHMQFLLDLNRLLLIL